MTLDSMVGACFLLVIVFFIGAALMSQARMK